MLVVLALTRTLQTSVFCSWAISRARNPFNETFSCHNTCSGNKEVATCEKKKKKAFSVEKGNVNDSGHTPVLPADPSQSSDLGVRTSSQEKYDCRRFLLPLCWKNPLEREQIGKEEKVADLAVR